MLKSLNGSAEKNGREHPEQQREQHTEAEWDGCDHHGIISLVCAFLSSTIIAAIIGFVLAIIATVSGTKCRNNGGSSAGFILGVLGIVFNCVGFVACVICFGGAALLA